MFTAAPLKENEKLLIAVVMNSVFCGGSKKLTGVGFGTVKENAQVPPGALQLLTGAPLPHVPLPENVVESALVVIVPKVVTTTASKIKER